MQSSGSPAPVFNVGTPAPRSPGRRPATSAFPAGGGGVETDGLGGGVGSAISLISLQNQTRADRSDLASPQGRREELPSSFQRRRASFSSRSGRGHPGGAQGEAGSGGGV